MPQEHYDLVVIGSGPAGQKGAINAAKLGKRVGIADAALALGGTCLHTGTIPSKSLREAVLFLSGYRQKAFYGQSYAVQHRITFEDLALRANEVITRELEVIRDQLARNRIEILEGLATFVDEHTLEIDCGEEAQRVTADYVLIACGARPAHSETVPVDGKQIFDSDQFVSPARKSQELARSLMVVGAGVIGVEYASMAAALGANVTVIDQREDVLEFADREMIEALFYHLRDHNTTLRFGEKVVRVEKDSRERVVAHLESGKRVTGETLLYTVGRQANADRLKLDCAGVNVDPRGRIPVDGNFRTSAQHIYAAGDVIGFPSLASTSMEQGRVATCHMFGAPFSHAPALLPYGIYTIPEISMVGKTEEQLTEQKIPYEVGTARFEELARGQMIGDRTGRLKLLFGPDDLKLLGVHIIGDGAAELVHIGQMVMSYGGTVELLRDSVFNYPTLAEAYKVAAFDGLNRL
ncbi:MAG: Si-specific NAD(P)(+) transhydrogenase [Deltaproteobacteria bacterium]|nr:Si-specific NAD(P)(+) transhydrogenase [Deltaproteobacteria bacterium]